MVKRKVVFVVPAYNETSSVGEVVEGALRLADLVIVVDDGSSDGTDETARAAGATVARHSENLGQGAAIQTGIELGLQLEATHLITFDADGQHRPQDALRMVDRLDAEGLDVVLGSRGGKRQVGMPLERHLLLRAGLLLSRITTGLDLTDTHNGLRAFTAEAASLLNITQDRMAHASQILSRIAELELAWAEEPVAVSYTSFTLGKGQSSLAALRIVADLARGRLGFEGDRSRVLEVRQLAIDEALVTR
ncbi:MAG: glycosyltransferase family 2 protein [Deltaproteobacteria bacterium]|nr:glycosyltransferase family 2 protein [Deltaproteobacteria bacterium]